MTMNNLILKYKRDLERVFYIESLTLEQAKIQNKIYQARENIEDILNSLPDMCSNQHGCSWGCYNTDYVFFKLTNKTCNLNSQIIELMVEIDTYPTFPEIIQTVNAKVKELLLSKERVIYPD